MKHYKIKVLGRVQGVWFRQGTFLEANRLGLKGIVQNLPDGSVQIEAEGDEGKLQELLDWCKDGPEHASVESVTYTEDKPKNYKDFTVA